ncbi:hypothetical protein [Larkinella humicola]|uniref:Uncharacterized protein n=1 Tax=Larkinella humicola TaxID=2607654 RepID=A0A5N1JAM5_9BACT|nr:hypothetical protein [Larkinella humicola]KAA9349727.1 hypothetical protein F0P93_19950 [Larkinella humicola]
MFDQPYDFHFVQRNTNKKNSIQRQLDPELDYQYEYIYKFFVSNAFCRRKIIVQIKQYNDTVFKVDFYATTSNKERKVRNENLSAYRYLTKVGRANRVAGTIFAIIGTLRRHCPDMSFGFQAATLLNEANDNNNRRYQVYLTMMQLVTGSSNNPWKAFGYSENSYIFVIQKRFLQQKPQIIEEYGRIFGKVFEN